MEMTETEFTPSWAVFRMNLKIVEASPSRPFIPQRYSETNRPVPELIDYFIDQELAKEYVSKNAKIGERYFLCAGYFAQKTEIAPALKDGLTK